MSNSYDWENNKKIYKKVHPWAFGKRSCFTKSSKQDGCYLVLLKVQYRSSASDEFFMKNHLIIDQEVK